MAERPQTAALFPYTTLFRSVIPGGGDHDRPRGDGVIDGPLQQEGAAAIGERSEEHTSELQSRQYLVCRLLREKKNRLRTGESQPQHEERRRHTPATREQMSG